MLLLFCLLTLVFLQSFAIFRFNGIWLWMLTRTSLSHFWLQDSDEESRGANANLLTTSVTSTTSFTGKSTTSGAGLFDNNSSRPLNITAPMFGAPIAVESQRTVSEAIDGKSTAASGGFTFPSSNPFGTSLDAPPTPKPFPSPSNTGPSPKPNGLPAYKYNTGPSVDNMFKLPVAPVSDGGFDNAHTPEVKSNHQLDSKSDFSQRYTSGFWHHIILL